MLVSTRVKSTTLAYSIAIDYEQLVSDDRAQICNVSSKAVVMTTPNNQTLQVSGATDCKQVSYLTTECKSVEPESKGGVRMSASALCQATDGAMQIGW